MTHPDPQSPFLVFGAPRIEDAEIAEVEACLRSGWLGTGPRVAQFEKDFARWRGVLPSQVAAVNSCTAALHVSMVAANLEPGSEVITTPLTFCATVNAVLHAGLTPVLADVDPVTQNIDPDAIEAAITPRTRALLPVHFAGRPCAMDRIMAILLRSGVLIAATLVLIGGIIFLSRHSQLTDYKTFQSEPAELRTIPGIFQFARQGHGRGLIQLGLLLLIATPVALL